MKKLLFLALSIFMVSTSVLAWERVPLTIIGDDNEPVGHDLPRGPIEAPTVYIEDYSLLFETNHPDYVLNIKDVDGNVVYSTTVYSVLTLAPLPYTLSGDYEIELFYGGWIFTGNISL